MMKNLTKETRMIVVAIAIIVALIFAMVLYFNLRKRIRAKLDENRAIRDLKQYENSDNEIASETGLKPMEVARAREIAISVAEALNVDKNSGMFNYGEDEERVILELNRAESEQEIVLVQRFYRDIATDGRNLLVDLQKFLYGWQRSKIDWINYIR